MIGLLISLYRFLPSALTFRTSLLLTHVSGGEILFHDIDEYVFAQRLGHPIHNLDTLIFLPWHDEMPN